ncbi:MAG: PP2C family protein-serine/threonine phosphatase [bacterium]
MAIKTSPESVTINQLKEENARLKKSVQELVTINELARIISSTMSLEKVLDRVVASSVKAIDAEQGTIHLLEKMAGGDPFKTLIRKADETTPADKYRLDDVLSGWMIKHRNPLLINDFSRTKLFKGSRPEDEKIKTLLSVPLMCKGGLIGVLNLFNKKGPGVFSEDDQRLLCIIASQSAQVIENARLYEEEKQLRLFEQEVEMARAIQHRLLPKEDPKIAGFDVAGVSDSAKEVGGDYFDFIDLGNDRWAIALGDISGKGIPASLLMAYLQATLGSQVLTTPSLVQCIANTNNILYRNTPSDKFVTLFCGILDLSGHSFEYVNAGHNYPFHLNQNGEFSSLETGGVVLGMLPDCRFEPGKVQLDSGDVLVIYSDGVTEAENEIEVLFGEARLQKVMKANRHLSARQIIEKIFQSIKKFTGPKVQDDDITLIVLKRE